MAVSSPIHTVIDREFVCINCAKKFYTFGSCREKNGLIQLVMWCEECQKSNLKPFLKRKSIRSRKID